MTATEPAILAPEVALRPVTDPAIGLDLDGAPESLSSPAAPAALLRRLLVALDATAAALGWLIGLLVTDALYVESSAGIAPTLVPFVVLMTATTIVLVAGQRLYLARVCTIRAVEINRLGRACAAAAVVALLSPRVLPIEISAGGAAAAATLSFVHLMAFRGLYRHWLQIGRRDGRFLRPVVIVGSGDEGFELYKLTREHPEMGFKVVGVVGLRADVARLEYLVPYLGDYDHADEALFSVGANGAILAAGEVPSAQLNSLIRTFLRDGMHVHLSSGLRGFDHRRLRAQPLAHEPLFYLEPLLLSPWQIATKRAIDVVVSIVGGLALAAPVLVVAAIAIKLQDGGPVFYRQTRVGRNGKSFTILKLRTMAPNADRLYAVLAETQAGRDGPLIKIADDPRRTKVGRFLERLSIDELPQLWNVVRGEMSLVGPRPAQAAEVAEFDEALLARLTVRPGITGLWQVEARDNPSYAAYRRYDLFYLENWSVSLDLAIFVATFQRVLLRGVELIVRRKPELSASVMTVPVD